VPLLLPVAILLSFQIPGNSSALAQRIQTLFHIVLMSDDDKQEQAAVAEAKEIFAKQGLPITASVGEEAAYKFVFLRTGPGGPPEKQFQV
jgi:hypothetical protein